MSSETKLKTLKILLVLGGVYYIIGAVAHFFGLTIFPFYDSHLYTPYHDTVIALASIILSLFLFAVAKNPTKNIDTLNIFIIGGFIAIAFSVYILTTINFLALGAPEKHTQTIIETILLIFYIAFLIYLHPKK